MMDWLDLVKILLPIFIFFGTAFFWLWSRLEAKRLEDKNSFIDIYEKLRRLDSRVAYMLGKQGVKFEEIPDTELI